jgi:hypothetical protein
MWALSEINFKWLTVMIVWKDHHSVPKLFFLILTVDRKHIISLCSAITNTVLVSWHVTVMLLSMMGLTLTCWYFLSLKSELL